MAKAIILIPILLVEIVLGGYGNNNNANDQYTPQFRPTPRNITVGPGDRAVLKCRIENLGTKTVTWKRQEELHPLTIGLYTFDPDTRISVEYNQRTNEWSLMIQDVKPTDEGGYQCMISTKDNEKNFYNIQLNVKRRPRERFIAMSPHVAMPTKMAAISKKPNQPATTEKACKPKIIYRPEPVRGPAVQVTGQEYVEKGEAVHLICNATGKPDPPHDVEWYKDGVKIHSNAQSGILITKKIETKVLISVLVIKKSTLEHAGDYVCRSSNRDAGSIQIHILNVPSANVERPEYGNSGTSQQKLASGGSKGLQSHRDLFLLSLSTLMSLLVTQAFTRWRNDT